METSPVAEPVLRELNPWWEAPHAVLPRPPGYRRSGIVEVRDRLRSGGGLAEVILGPRQVGKTTGLHQMVEDLLADGVPPREILFVRFDLELLREFPQGLVGIVRWFEGMVLRRSLREGRRPIILLDEVHKLPRWDEEVKHVIDTFQVKLVLTGSSSVLVARGGRESLAGRVFATEVPTFSFREILEAWQPKLAAKLPPRIRFLEAFERQVGDAAAALHELRPQQRLALGRHLERYFNRGGYPRLHSGEIDENRWADYLTQTVFENVLGADIPALFPVQDPGLLRHLYLMVARLTGQEVSQLKLVEHATNAGFKTTQPTVGRYLHYLSDALLIRQFRRYPLARKATARVPAKLSLGDLGVRNAILRNAPSLWEGDPAVLGPLVETLAQTVIRGSNLQVHFWRDYLKPGVRSSPVLEVDFVAERSDGTPLPIEIKFRRKVGSGDRKGLLAFLDRFPAAPHGILVTRDEHQLDEERRILHLPLLSFLLLF